MQLFKDQLELYLQLCIDNNPRYRKLFTNPEAPLNFLPIEDTTAPRPVAIAPLQVVIDLYDLYGNLYGISKYREKKKALVDIIFKIYGDKVFVTETDEKLECLVLSVDPELLQPVLRIENDAQAVSTSKPVVYIRLRPARFQCQDCDNQPTTTEKSNWYTRRIYSPHFECFR